MPQGCGCGPAGGRAGMDCATFQETCLPEITGDSGCDVRLSSNGVLTIPISSQSGQILQCADDGLYAPADDTPGVLCEPTLSDPFWVSTRGGGGKLTPYGSPAGIDYAVNHRLDAAINFIWYTPDRVAIWAVPDISSTSTVYMWGQRIDSSQPLPGQAGNYGDFTSDSFTNTISPAGTPDTAVPNNDFLTPVNPEHHDEDEPDGGWFGWHSAPFTPLSLESALDRLDCRALAFLRLRATDHHLLVDQIPWLVEDLQRWGRARAAVPLLTPATYERAEDFSDAGISPGVSLVDDQSLTPADLVAAGVEYVMLDAALQDADRRQDFYDESELTVMTHVEMSRHYESEAEIDAGADGIVSDDAVYSRGYDGDDATTYYETTRLYDAARNKQVGTHSEGGPFDDGYTGPTTRRYLYIPSPTDDEETVGDRREFLSGALDIDDPTNYDVTFAARTNDTQRVVSASMRIGIAVGSPSDVGAWPEFAPDGMSDQYNNYRIEAISSTGTTEADLGITKVEAGSHNDIDQVDTFFDVATFPTIRCSVQVRATTITVISYDVDWAVNNTYEFEDADFRGGYVFLVGRTTATDDAPVEHSFVNLIVGMPDTALGSPGVQSAADESRTFSPANLVDPGGD